MDHSVGVPLLLKLTDAVAQQSSISIDSIDWPAALATLITLAAGALKLGTGLAPFFEHRDRSMLKADLEMLKLIETTGLSTDIVKSDIDARIKRLYSNAGSEEEGKPIDWASLIGSLALFVGFAYWTFRLARPEFNGWAVLTGYLAIIGLAGFIGSVSRRPPSKVDASVDESQGGNGQPKP